MGTTGLNEGHEKTGTGATWQADGLRDTDVLSSASLTNMVERGITNGVVPINLTNYSQDSGGSDRNNPIVGNCVVRPNSGGGTNSIFVDQGVVCLDGCFYTVGSANAFNIDTANHYNARFNAAGMVLPTQANQECWVLVIVDPELNGTNNIGLVCGDIVDTSTGVYPQMPYSHLVKQSVVLGAVRVSFANPLNVAAIEDKRIFIRGGPIPLTSLVNAGGAGTDPLNDYSLTPALNAGNLPIAGLGMFYTRDPTGHSPSNTQPHGAGQTHLFFQSDQAVGVGNGGSYQITPVHRMEKEHITTPAQASAIAPLAFTPLLSQTGNNLHLISINAPDALALGTIALIEGVHYSVSGKVITTLVAMPSATVEVIYTHAGY